MIGVGEAGSLLVKKGGFGCLLGGDGKARIAHGCLPLRSNKLSHFHLSPQQRSVLLPVALNEATELTLTEAS